MSGKGLKAVAYLRTVQQTNVGAGQGLRQAAARRDQPLRQARRLSRSSTTFYDAAVSGADPVNERPAFAHMLERLLGNGVRTIIVESPDRFARDLIQQLLGHDLLKARGITLIAASSPQHFLEDTPTAILIRQVLGGVAEFEKTTLVAKLKAARDRKRKATGKCGGRKSHLEKRPAAVALAKSLARKNGRLSCAPSPSSLRLRAMSTSVASRSIRSRSPACWGGSRHEAGSRAAYDGRRHSFEGS